MSILDTYFEQFLEEQKNAMPPDYTEWLRLIYNAGYNRGYEDARDESNEEMERSGIEPQWDVPEFSV